MKDLKILRAALPAAMLCSMLLAGSSVAFGKDLGQAQIGAGRSSKVISTTAKARQATKQVTAKKRTPRAMTKSTTPPKK